MKKNNGVHIPKGTRIDKIPDVATKTVANQEERLLLFSFEILEYNDYFNLNKTCERWGVDFINLLADLSKVTVKQFRCNPKFKSGTYRIHSHEDSRPPPSISFPPKVKELGLKQFWQIALDKSSGRIHGILIDNVFYIIWLDPLHNLYPSKQYANGKHRKVTPPQKCCCDMYKAEIERLTEFEKLYNNT